MVPAVVEMFNKDLEEAKKVYENAVLYYAFDDSGYVIGMIHEVAGAFALGTPEYSEYCPR